MDEITKNNVVALLEECYTNGEEGPGSLWMWFLHERPLIERTLESAHFGEHEEEVEDDEEEVQEEDYKWK